VRNWGSVVPLRRERRPRANDPRRDLRGLLFGLRGRIGRTTYAWAFGLSAAGWLAGFQLVQLLPLEAMWRTQAAGWVVTAPLAWIAVAVTVKRAQDCGLNGGVAVLLALPVARWLFALGMLLAPSEPTWNRFGHPPDRED
jgi:uncharacterized membrane protein YhaH (DUF805 family)